MVSLDLLLRQVRRIAAPAGNENNYYIKSKLVKFSKYLWYICKKEAVNH